MIPVQADDPLVSLADISEIELVILKRMSEVTLGDHHSRSHGSGFDFLGLRDWQPGDKISSIGLESVVAYQFRSIGGPRVRAAEHRSGHRHCRHLAVDPVRPW